MLRFYTNITPRVKSDKSECANHRIGFVFAMILSKFESKPSHYAEHESLSLIVYLSPSQLTPSYARQLTS